MSYIDPSKNLQAIQSRIKVIPKLVRILKTGISVKGKGGALFFLPEDPGSQFIPVYPVV
jgi:hypothetical protein